MVKRASWLSITPEPERELPEAVATLAAGHRAGPEPSPPSEARIERLILHGSQRRWLAYLHDVVDLIAASAGSDDPDVAPARARATKVIANHHNLLLGLPGAARAHRHRPSRLRALDRDRLTKNHDRGTDEHDDHRPDHDRADRRAARPPAARARVRRAGPAPAGAQRRGRRRARCPRRPSSTSSARRSRRACRAGGSRAELGGQGWSMLEWFLVNEQFGRVTNGLHWHVPSVYNVLGRGHARADAALRGAGAARRGRRRLRRHRGRGRLGSRRDRHHRASPPTPAGGSTGRSGSSPPATSPAC